METSNDAVSLRISRLNSQLLAKNTSRDAGLKAISRDTLLDAFTVLYDECNNDSLKHKDTLISKFVDKYRKTISEMKKTRVNLSDFEVKNIIGRGHFGQVNVVKEKHTDDVYAMKTIRKWDSLKTKSLAFEEERDIMSLATSPWLTSLQYAFQDSSHLYLIMEFHPGGELLSILEKQGDIFTENQAVFYLSELVEAVHALHCMGYVHRDVKPENILLDSTGHVKLVDFGSAAKLGKNNLVEHEDGVPVGTSDYIAVEVLKSSEKSSTSKVSYGSECDYWSVGVIAYELLIGSTPFSSSTIAETYNKIMNYTKYLQIPNYANLSENYTNLIFSLITAQKTRLNYRQIISHSLFKDTDWTSLRDQLAPFIPEVSGADDTSNFVNPDASQSCPNIENFITRNRFSGRNLPFIGFTYSNTITTSISERPIEVLEAEICDKNRRKTELEEKSLVEFMKKEFSIDYQELEQRLESVDARRRELEETLASRDIEVQKLSLALKTERMNRAVMEEKALKLAQEARSRWNDIENSLIERIQKYANFAVSRTIELSTVSSERDKYKNQLVESEAKIQRLQAISSDQNESLTKFHQMNKKIKRKSKLKARRVKVENDIKIKQLKRRISVLTKERSKRKRQVKTRNKTETPIENTCDQCKNLQTNLLSSRNECEQLQNKINQMEHSLETSYNELKSERDTYKEQVGHLAQSVSEFEQLLQKEKKNYQQLTTQIDLMSQKRTSLLQEQHRIVEREKLRHEAEIKSIEARLNDALKQVENFNNLLESVQDKNAESASKENKLQGLLERLETGVKRWEANTEEESSLQKQIEQLSAQIKELQEASVVETKARRDALLKLWRSEKELSNCKIEKRELERNSKQKDEQIVLLNDELKTRNEEYTKIETLHNENVTKSSEELKELKGKVETVLNLQRITEEELGLFKSKYEKERCLAVEITEQLTAALDENKSLKSKLQIEIQNMNTLNIELESLTENNSKVQSLLGKIKTTCEKYKNELQDISKKNKNLTDTCALLDGQLHLCDEIISKNEKREKELLDEIRELKLEKETISLDTKKHLDAVENERKEKIQITDNCGQLELKLQSLQEELISHKNQVMEYKDELNKANMKFKLMEEKQHIQIACEEKLKKRNKELEADLINKKAECSSRLTAIHKLRESNYILKEELTVAKERNENLTEKLTEQHTQNQQQNVFYKEREIKSNATIAQQRKLIDFLQTKLNSDKKKKETKLFGSHKKENIPPLTNSNPREINTNKSKRHMQFPFTKTKKNSHMEQESNEHEINTPCKPIVNEATISEHKYVKKAVMSSVKCDFCYEPLEVNLDAFTCVECNKNIHPNCQKHLNLIPCKPSGTELEDEVAICEHVRMKGWIKFRAQCTNEDWLRRYARLEDSVLAFYNAEPTKNSTAIFKLDLCTDTSACEEVFANEVRDVTNAQLPFIFRIDLMSSAKTSIMKSYFIMAESETDKEAWLVSINELFFEKQLYSVEKKYKTVMKLDQKIESNCIQELSKNVLLLGCEEGLFAKVDDNNLLHILGPECVDEIRLLKSVNLALMIVGQNRSLVKVQLLNLTSLVQCAPCTQPKLKYAPVTNEDGFLLFEVSDCKHHQYLCTATSRHLLLLKYDIKTFDFISLRKLDTAEPVSCILFKNQSVIVGADKFFKIDLKTFVADEFLKSSNRDLAEVTDCFKRNSFPQGIILVNSDPCEYLLCFNECGIFVNEFGHRSRNADLKWSRLPVMFEYCSPYLYVSHFTAVEIILLTTEMGKNEETWINASRERIDFVKPKCLGRSVNGIYVSTSNEIVHVSSNLNEDIWNEESETEEDNKSDTGTEFSFSSSIINSLDRGSTDNDQDM